MIRRTFMISVGASVASALAPPTAYARPFATPSEQCAAIEKHTGGRLGVFAVDTGSHRRFAYRGDERFPMCSTFKFLAVAAVLSRVDSGAEHLERQIPYSKHDLLADAPVTTAHVADGAMSIAELCLAAIEHSDNTAANLLLATLGGTVGVTRYARSIGDAVTHLDRNEPTVNTAIPGDPRDTTTPRAMAADMQTILLGDALSPRSRRDLRSWLDATQTGFTSIRGGIPNTWSAGDKTGTGDHGTHNDIAILLPPHRNPILVTSYLTGAAVTFQAQAAALADVGRIVAQTFG